MTSTFSYFYVLTHSSSLLTGFPLTPPSSTCCLPTTTRYEKVGGPFAFAELDHRALAAAGAVSAAGVLLGVADAAGVGAADSLTPGGKSRRNSQAFPPTPGGGGVGDPFTAPAAFHTPAQRQHIHVVHAGGLATRHGAEGLLPLETYFAQFVTVREAWQRARSLLLASAFH